MAVFSSIIIYMQSIAALKNKHQIENGFLILRNVNTQLFAIIALMKYIIFCSPDGSSSIYPTIINGAIVFGVSDCLPDYLVILQQHRSTDLICKEKSTKGSQLYKIYEMKEHVRTIFFFMNVTNQGMCLKRTDTEIQGEGELYTIYMQ